MKIRNLNGVTLTTETSPGSKLQNPRWNLWQLFLLTTFYFVQYNCPAFDVLPQDIFGYGPSSISVRVSEHPSEGSSSGFEDTKSTTTWDFPFSIGMSTGSPDTSGSLNVTASKGQDHATITFEATSQFQGPSKNAGSEATVRFYLPQPTFFKIVGEARWNSSTPIYSKQYLALMEEHSWGPASVYSETELNLDASSNGYRVIGDMVGLFPITNPSSGWLAPGRYGFTVVDVLGPGDFIVQANSFTKIELQLFSVPEPSVWIFLGLGFLTLNMGVWRRGRTIPG